METQQFLAKFLRALPASQLSSKVRSKRHHIFSKWNMLFVFNIVTFSSHSPLSAYIYICIIYICIIYICVYIYVYISIFVSLGNLRQPLIEWHSRQEPRPLTCQLTGSLKTFVAMPQDQAAADQGQGKASEPWMTLELVDSCPRVRSDERRRLRQTTP